MAAETRPRRSPRQTGQIAKAYFGAIADRDLDARGRAVEAGRDATCIHGIADLTAPDDIKAFFSGLLAAFPDFEFEILELAASGKNAACRWRSTGTFTGPGRFQGLAPTGARIEMEGCDMLRVEDGLIVENNAYTSTAPRSPSSSACCRSRARPPTGRHRRLQREDRRARPPAPPARLAAQSQRTGVVVPDSQSSRRIA